LIIPQTTLYKIIIYFFFLLLIKKNITNIPPSVHNQFFTKNDKPSNAILKADFEVLSFLLSSGPVEAPRTVGSLLLEGFESRSELLLSMAVSIF